METLSSDIGFENQGMLSRVIPPIFSFSPRY
jgi:hypothetical protein